MNKSVIKFVDYFKNPLHSHVIIKANKANNIDYSKCYLFNMYVLSLIIMVSDTYLGDDVDLTEEDIKNHFDWCWQKNNHNFKLFGFNIPNNGEHHNYFLNYFLKFYYYNEEDKTNVKNNLIDLWDVTISYGDIKSQALYDLFLEVYKILDKYFFNSSI